MGRELTRRNVLRLGGGALAGIGALGWSGGRGWRAAAQDRQRIRAAGFVESQQQLQATLAALVRYGELHPDVEIIPEFTDFGSYTDKLATEAAGGNAPDMLTTNGSLMGEYARRGILRPLDEYVPDPIDLSDYAAPTINGNTIDGQLFGVPNDCIAPTLVYNTAVFEQAGIPVPDQFWTWDAYAQTATDLSTAMGEGFYGTEDGGGSSLAFDVFLRGRGKEFNTADRQLGFDQADLAAWYGFWQGLRESGGAPPGEVQASSSTDDLSRTGLITGWAAILPQLTDAYFGLQSLTEDVLGLHMLPNGFSEDDLPQRHFAYAGNSTSISAQTEHAPTVVDIIRFMHNDPEGIEIFYQGSGLVPATSQGRQEMLANGTPGEQRVVEYIELLLAEPGAERNPSISGLGGILLRMNEEVAFGRLSVDEAAAEFFAEAEAKLS